MSRSRSRPWAEADEAGGDAAVAEGAAVEAAGEPERSKILKEEERKVEHVLKHIDLIRKLEGDVAKAKETLATKKLSEPKRKEPAARSRPSRAR